MEGSKRSAGTPDDRADHGSCPPSRARGGSGTRIDDVDHVSCGVVAARYASHSVPAGVTCADADESNSAGEDPFIQGGEEPTERGAFLPIRLPEGLFKMSAKRSFSRAISTRRVKVIASVRCSS